MKPLHERFPFFFPTDIKEENKYLRHPNMGYVHCSRVVGPYRVYKYESHYRTGTGRYTRINAAFIFVSDTRTNEVCMLNPVAQDANKFIEVLTENP